MRELRNKIRGNIRILCRLVLNKIIIKSNFRDNLGKLNMEWVLNEINKLRKLYFMDKII